MHQRWTRRDILRTALGAGALLRAARVCADTPAMPAHPGVAAVTVRLDERHQVIENFGASDSWSMGPIGREWGVEQREHLADLLFSRGTGIGLSGWRYYIGAGSDRTDTAAIPDPWRAVPCFRRAADGPYDWGAQAGQDWFLDAAKRRGVEQFVAYAISPPVWLTKNGHAYGDPQSGSTNLKTGGEAAYARFLCDVLAHFRDLGLPFTYVSPINEPGWGWEAGSRQEGCRYNVDDTIRVIRALHREMQARHLTTQIIAPEAVDLEALLDDADYRAYTGGSGVFTAGNADPKLGRGLYRNYIQRLIGDADLRAILNDRIVAHAYGDENHGDPKSLIDLRRAVRANLDSYSPGAKYWMSEFCIMEGGRDFGMDAALRVTAMMHHDLVDGEASGWQWWTAVSPEVYKDGLLYTDYQKTGEQTILPTKLFWAFGNFSRFVRPGARRVGVDAAGASDLLVSAYLNAHSRQPVIVAINRSSSVQSMTLAAHGKPLSLTPYVTSGTASLSPGPRLALDAPFAIPARSVVTFV